MNRTPLRRKNRLRRQSKRRAVEDAQYREKRRDFIASNPVCQVGARGCTVRSEQVHHRKGRGKLLNDRLYWLAVCAVCHDWIHANPEEARERGWMVSRLQPPTENAE